MQSTALQKYLQTYAEKPTGYDWQQQIEHVYQRAVLIPAYDEPLQALQQACDCLRDKHSILVWLDNYPSNSHSPDSHQAHRKYLQENYSCKEMSGTGFIMAAIGNSLVVYADLALDKNQGVGLARKTACDIACQLFALGIIQSNWMFSSDADIVFEDELFNFSCHESESSALLLRFEHINNGDALIHAATQLYESVITYYQKGLEFAGSRYSYHSLGSTMIIDINDYASARGFPKRQAAEDFYLLNKLNKLNGVETLDKPVLKIKSRISNRNPFGTGPGVKNILSKPQPWLQHTFSYHPACFELLAEFLSQCSERPASPGNNQIINILGKIGWQDFLDHCNKQAVKQQQYAKVFLQWFDAFRTLKFIHAARDMYYPDITLQEITRIADKKNPGVIPDYWRKL